MQHLHGLGVKRPEGLGSPLMEMEDRNAAIFVDLVLVG